MGSKHGFPSAWHTAQRTFAFHDLRGRAEHTQ